MSELKLNSEKRESLIDSFDYSFVIERFEHEHPMSNMEMEATVIEFKRFLKLILTENKPLAIIDKRVDALWHTFILFTEKYIDFCSRIMGFYVHHRPRTRFTPITAQAVPNFVNAYELKFGKLTSFWYETLEPDMHSFVTGSLSYDKVISRWSGWPGNESKLDNSQRFE